MLVNNWRGRILKMDQSLPRYRGVFSSVVDPAPPSSNWRLTRGYSNFGSAEIRLIFQTPIDASGRLSLGGGLAIVAQGEFVEAEIAYASGATRLLNNTDGMGGLAFILEGQAVLYRWRRIEIIGRSWVRLFSTNTLIIDPRYPGSTEPEFKNALNPVTIRLSIGLRLIRRREMDEISPQRRHK